MRRVSRRLDRLGVTLDDPNLVANAGLLLVWTLVARLGLERPMNRSPADVGRYVLSQPPVAAVSAGAGLPLSGPRGSGCGDDRWVVPEEEERAASDRA